MESDFFTQLEKQRENFILEYYGKFTTILALAMNGSDDPKANINSNSLQAAKIYREEMESFLDRKLGKPMQRQQHSGDKENPVIFMPFEILEKHGATQGTTNNSL